MALNDEVQELLSTLGIKAVTTDPEFRGFLETAKRTGILEGMLVVAASIIEAMSDEDMATWLNAMLLGTGCILQIGLIGPAVCEN